MWFSLSPNNLSDGNVFPESSGQSPQGVLRLNGGNCSSGRRDYVGPINAQMTVSCQ